MTHSGHGVVKLFYHCSCFVLFFVMIKEVNDINSATATTNKRVTRNLGERENHGAKIRVHVLDCSEDGHVKGSNRDVIIVER